MSYSTDGLKFRGKALIDLVNASGTGSTVIAETVNSFLNAEEKAVMKGFVAVGVDPDIVKKQAELIRDLQEALDAALVKRYDLDAPSFRKYAELEAENRRLRAKLEIIEGVISESKA